MIVSEAYTEFGKRKKDISDVTSSLFLTWCNYVNRRAYEILTGTMPEQYIASQTYTISPQVATYALPTAFRDIIPMGTGLYLVDNDGKDTDTRLPLTGFGSSQPGFYLTPSSIVMTPIPQATTVYKLRYIPKLTDLAAVSDTLVIPDRYSDHLMNVLDTFYNIWDEDQQMEAWNDERAQRSLNEMLQYINPSGQVIALPDFTSAY